MDGKPARPGEVRYSTVHRFKGLEADCAICVLGKREGGDAGRQDAADRLLYVAASRARLVLTVVRCGGWERR